MQETDLSNYWGGEYVEPGGPLAKAMTAVFGKRAKTPANSEQAVKSPAQLQSRPYSFYVIVQQGLTQFFFDAIDQLIGKGLTKSISKDK